MLRDPAMSKQRYELLVGLHVTDQEGYTRYRQEMKPMLDVHGGSFTYDFTIDQALVNCATHPINRLFVISFPSEDARKAFFNDPAYRQVRETWFVPAVGGATIISTWLTQATGA
jgi:uncharacterized protein (DUF1330 family)